MQKDEPKGSVSGGRKEQLGKGEREEEGGWMGGKEKSIINGQIEGGCHPALQCVPNSAECLPNFICPRQRRPVGTTIDNVFIIYGYMHPLQ